MAGASPADSDAAATVADWVAAPPLSGAGLQPATTTAKTTEKMRAMSNDVPPEPKNLRVLCGMVANSPTDVDRKDTPLTARAQLVPPLRLVLLHGQRTGDRLWHATAQRLHARGVRALTPQLPSPEHIYAPWWLAHAAGIANALPEDGSVILIAHGDSSVLLPAAGRLARNRDIGARVAGYMVVDGYLPADGKSLLDVVDATAADALRHACRGGFLPPLPVPTTELAPGDATTSATANTTLDHGHAALADALANAPRVPVSFYEEAITVPDDWPEAPCSYLRLSPAYASAEASAANRGWQTRSVHRHHLLPASEPDLMADLLEDMLQALLTAPARPPPSPSPGGRRGIRPAPARRP